MKKFLRYFPYTLGQRMVCSPELFRNRLTDLFDRLLIILEKIPIMYSTWTHRPLCLRTILPSVPRKKQFLCSTLKNRRIIVGPWYLQNDFYLTSGESTRQKPARG